MGYKRYKLYNLSKKDKIIIKISKLGYKVINSKMYTPDGKTLSTQIVENKGEYRKECIKLLGCNISIHRVIAYQKYGNNLFEEGIEVRHSDSNSLNNFDNNISIGTKSENELDKDPKIRLRSSIKASNKIRRFTDAEIKAIKLYHSECKSYGKTMKKFNILSKGSLYYILNTKYKTNK